MRLGQGLVSQNPWRAFTPASLFFSACGALVLNPRYQTSLERPPILLNHPPAPPRTTHASWPAPRTPPRGSFSRRSSSVPTRRLGLRPITCLPVIRCCANLLLAPLSPPTASREPIPSVFPKTRNQENPPTAERIRNNHRPHNRGVSIILFRREFSLLWETSSANDTIDWETIHRYFARKCFPSSWNLPRSFRHNESLLDPMSTIAVYMLSLYSMLQASRLYIEAISAAKIRAKIQGFKVSVLDRPSSGSALYRFMFFVSVKLVEFSKWLYTPVLQGNYFPFHFTCK